ncbi:hypothetical protein Plhal304r1_c065g0152971 [Plasmopara halstedii]
MPFLVARDHAASHACLTLDSMVPSQTKPMFTGISSFGSSSDYDSRSRQ